MKKSIPRTLRLNSFGKRQNAPTSMPSIFWVPLLVAALALVSGGRDSTLLALQHLEPLSVADALQTRSIEEESPLALSPDGKWVAYVLHNNQKIPVKTGNEETDLYVRTGTTLAARADDVWISNTESGEKRNLTAGIGTSWDPVWSNDGRYLAFLSTRDGSEQARLWAWDSVRNYLSVISKVSIRESALDNGIQWMPDSKRILVTTVPEGLSSEEYAKKVLSPVGTAKAGTNTAPGSTVTLYEQHPTRLTGNGSPNADMFNLDAQYLRDLVLVDVMTGKTSTVLHGHKIGWHSLSPDGRRVACAIPTKFEEPGSFQRLYDLVTVNLATMQEQVLATDILLDDMFSWSPDGSLLAYGAYEANRRSYDYSVVSVTIPGSRKISVLPYHPHLDNGLSRVPIWHPEGRYLYFIEDGALIRASVFRDETVEVARIPNRIITHRIARSANRLWTLDSGKSTVVVAHDVAGKQDGFYRVDLRTGKSTKLVEAGQCYSCTLAVGVDINSPVSANGQAFVYTAEDAQHPPDLWITDDGFRSSRRLTHLNSQLDKYEMGAAQVIDWLSDDGEPLHGALLLPAGYEAGNKYPLIVWVYPGVSLSDHFDQFGLGQFPGPFDMQLFATRGFAVLFPDAQDEVGDRIGGLEKSILAGINRVLGMGIADPARIGLMGHSQGGYATLALITRTNRFRAAAECSGWGDYAGLYGSMNQDGTGFQYGQTERQLGGPPWQNPEKYIQNSPIFYLDRVTTPLLIVQGSHDATLSPLLGEEVFVGLRRLGKEVEYAEYGGETHAPSDWSYPNQVDLANRILTWFDSHLKTGAQQNDKLFPAARLKALETR